MKVLKSVIDEGTYQRKSRDRPETNLINVFHANADAISYFGQHSIFMVDVGGTLGTRDAHAVHWN